MRRLVSGCVCVLLSACGAVWPGLATQAGDRGAARPPEAVVAKAREGLAERLGLEVRQVREKNFVQVNDEHLKLHGPSAPVVPVLTDPANDHHAGPFKGWLMEVDAGFGDKACGEHRVLLREGAQPEYTDVLRPTRQSVAMSAAECAEVRRQLEEFFATLRECSRGRERIEPLLAANFSQIQFHTGEPLEQLTSEQRKNFVISLLDMAGVGQWILLEGMLVEDLGEEFALLGEATETRPAEALAKADRLGAQVGERVRQAGYLEEGHLRSVEPLLGRILGPGPVDKHIEGDGRKGDADWPEHESAEFEMRPVKLPPGTALYHSSLGQMDLYFIWEEGKLKLYALFCRD